MSDNTNASPRIVITPVDGSGPSEVITMGDQIVAGLVGSEPRLVPSQAMKFDTGKIPFELLPAPALEAIAEVLAFGKQKYDAWNWAKGFKWSRLLGAALRHLFAWARGEDRDPESGLSHLAHAGCCILFLLSHEICKLGTDDRFPMAKK